MPLIGVKAHEYFFAFAEVEYSEKTSKLEATLTLTAHDFESYLQKEKVIEKSLDNALMNDNDIASVEKVINTHFNFYEEAVDKESNWVSSFKIDGHQILLNGNIEIYLSCDLIKPFELLNVKFNLFMDYFSEQQNKITFINNRKKSTLEFTSTKQTQTIELY